MVPLQHRTEVLMAGVAGWGPEGQPWVPAHLARAYHEALGVSFQSSDPQKYFDVLLYWLTLAWGTEVTSFHLAPEAAAVSFAICDVVTREPTRAANKRYAGAQSGARSTPKKHPPEEKFHNMAVDQEATGGDAQARGVSGDGADEEEGERRPELTHKEPSYKNAQWLRKRPGAPRWTQKICRLLEGLMEADEIAEEVDMGAVVDDLWGILLDCDKAGKDALKTKIKEHKKRQKQKEKKQRKRGAARRRRAGRLQSTRKDIAGPRIRRPHRRVPAAATANRTRRHPGVRGRPEGQREGRRTKGASGVPISRSSSGLTASVTSREKKQETGCAAKGRPKVPAQTVEDLTGGSTGRSSGAKDVRNDFDECKRMPRSRPGHDRTGNQRWTGRGRAPVTSYRKRWRQGTGQISLPLSSGDGTKIHWVAICGRSKDWPGQSACDQATGRERFWSAGCWTSRRLTSRRARRRPCCRLHAWWIKWAGCPRSSGHRIGIWSRPSNSRDQKRTGPPRRSGRRSTTSSKSVTRRAARRTGRLWPRRACPWVTACDARRRGVQWGMGGKVYSFSGRSPGGGGSSWSWGPGDASGCSSLSSLGRSAVSTLTGGHGMGRVRRSERRLSACSRRGWQENDSVARLQEVAGGTAQAHGRPDAEHHALGRMEDPRGRDNVH